MIGGKNIGASLQRQGKTSFEDGEDLGRDGFQPTQAAKRLGQTVKLALGLSSVLLVARLNAGDHV
jgi:hypothetical protein